MVTKRLILLTLVCLSVHLCKAYDEYTYNDYQGAQVKATEPENPEEFAEENGEGDYVGLKPINVLEEAQVEAEEIEPHQDATIPENPEEFAEENGEGDYVGVKPINDLEEDAAVVEPETYNEYAEDLNPSTSVERWTVLITKVHTESESLEEKNIENEPEESLHPETEDAQVDVNDLEGPCRRMFKDNETDCLQNVPPPYESCQYSVDEELCSWKCECAMSATEGPYDGEEHEEHFEESHLEEHVEHEMPEEEQADSDVPRRPGTYDAGEGDYGAGYAEYAEYAGPEALPERECTGRTSHAMSAEKEHTDAPVEEAEEVEEEFSEGPCRRMFKANETDCLVNIPAEYDSCQYFVDEESCSWKCECAMIVTDAPHDYPAHEEAESSEGSSDSESREQTKCRKGKKKLGFKNPVVAMQGMIQWKNEDKKFKKKCCF